MARAFPFQPATVLAPMEGVTTPGVRALFASLGPVGLVCTEFLRIHPRTPLARVGAAVVRAPGVALSVQLMGAEPDALAEATRRLAEAGADVVDLNVGCPSRRAVKGGAGAALLRDPAQLGRVAGAMRRATSGLLSAKIRAGFDDAGQALLVGRALADAGVDFITVHPRRRVDGFAGAADWRIIAELAAALPLPVVGNGDLWYASDAARVRRETGCAAVMLGRPALRNPWIFRQIAELAAGVPPFRPSGADLVGHLRALHALFERTVGPAPRPLGALKEQLGYLARALPDNGAFRRRALRLEDPAAILALAERVLGRLPPDALDLDATGHLALEQRARLSATCAPTTAGPAVAR
ncbi:MAG TPA: tRNA-dihydrouridine synthase family protein [Polyangiaceae bacterium]|nr:tRNA-dihydrouridine synthase family protein [Polyangiaceae bacterium]